MPCSLMLKTLNFQLFIPSKKKVGLYLPTNFLCHLCKSQYSPSPPTSGIVEITHFDLEVVHPSHARPKVYANFTIMPMTKVNESVFTLRIWFNPKASRTKHFDILKFLVNNFFLKGLLVSHKLSSENMTT